MRISISISFWLSWSLRSKIFLFDLSSSSIAFKLSALNLATSPSNFFIFSWFINSFSWLASAFKLLLSIYLDELIFTVSKLALLCSSKPFSKSSFVFFSFCLSSFKLSISSLSACLILWKLSSEFLYYSSCLYLFLLSSAICLSN